MTKTEKIVLLLTAKDHMKRKMEFYKILYRLMVNDLFALMGDEYDITKVAEEKPHIKMVLNDLCYLMSYDQIKSRHAKQILEAAWNTDEYSWDICHYILDTKMFDEVNIDSIIDEVIKEQTQAWDQCKSGKDKVIGRLIGQVMKKTQGKADPEEAKKIFEDKRGIQV